MFANLEQYAHDDEPSSKDGSLSNFLFGMLNTMPNNEPSSATTTSVERALSILELAALDERGLSHSEISRRLEIPKSTTTYLLRTLEHRGYLRKNEDSSRYQIGIKVLGLGQHVMAGANLTRISHRHLTGLVEKTRLTAHLAILDHGRAVYIDRAESPGFVKINTWIGRDLPIHSTGVGKILTCELNPADLDQILERDGLPKKTPKTITSRTDYLTELTRVRKLGYALDDEENNLGVRCVAVPVRDSTGRIRAAVGASGTTSLFPSDAIPQMASQAQHAARSISEELGFGTVDF